MQLCLTIKKNILAACEFEHQIKIKLWLKFDTVTYRKRSVCSRTDFLKVSKKCQTFILTKVEILSDQMEFWHSQTDIFRKKKNYIGWWLLNYTDKWEAILLINARQSGRTRPQVCQSFWINLSGLAAFWKSVRTVKKLMQTCSELLTQWTVNILQVGNISTY